MALDWLPIYPELIHPRERRPWHPLEVLNVEPIPNPPPPVDMTWQPHYPDHGHRRALPPAVIPSYVSGFPFLGTQLQARAVFPDYRLARRRLIPSGSTFDIGGLLDVPKRGSWRPRYPMQLRLAPRASLGFYAFVTPPSVILNAAPCVEWTDETLTNPALSPETLTNPSLTDETCISPTMTEEDLC